MGHEMEKPTTNTRARDEVVEDSEIEEKVTEIAEWQIYKRREEAK